MERRILIDMIATTLPSQRQQEHLMIPYLALVALLSFNIHQIWCQVKIQRLDVAHFAGQLQM